MPPIDPLYAAEWLELGKRDRIRVPKMFEIGEADLAAFCLQQSVEKYLKAYLISRGWRLKKVHDLNLLLSEAIKYDNAFSEYAVFCTEISSFYLLSRYNYDPEPTVEVSEIRSLFKNIEPLFELIEEKMLI
jgi:HEPN domain-containing protein